MLADLGACPCGGHYERRDIEVSITVDEDRVTLEHVLQGYCPFCGSRIYKAGDLEDIEALMGSRAARPLGPLP